MILEHTLTLENYELFVKIRNRQYSYSCPYCGSYGRFGRHGIYHRNLIFYDSGIREKRLPILRLKCKSCEHTHALLPKGVIPYRTYAFSFYIAVIKRLYSLKNDWMSCLKLKTKSYQYVYNFLSWFQSQIRLFIKMLDWKRHALWYFCYQWKRKNERLRNTIQHFFEKLLWYIFCLSIRCNVSIVIITATKSLVRSPHKFEMVE